MTEKSVFKMFTPSKNRKITKIYALSYNHALCFWCNCDFKKAPINFRDLLYQMDHIRWAPSMLKISLVIIFLKQ